MSFDEEKAADIEVDAGNSPASSTVSTSSPSDSDSMSDTRGVTPEPLDEEEEEEEHQVNQDSEITEFSAEDISNHAGLVVFGSDIAKSPKSTSSLDLEEEKRSSGDDYPLSQRVYCSASCKISGVLQRQCSELWKQFDELGTEMIVTRRGRYVCQGKKLTS